MKFYEKVEPTKAKFVAKEMVDDEHGYDNSYAAWFWVIGDPRDLKHSLAMLYEYRYPEGAKRDGNVNLLEKCKDETDPDVILAKVNQHIREHQEDYKQKWEKCLAKWRAESTEVA